MAAQRHRVVAGPLGQLDYLGGDGQPLGGLLGAAGTPDSRMAIEQHGRQRGRVAQAPGQLNGLLAERQAPPGLRRPQQRSGELGQHPGPQRAVGLAKRDIDRLDDAALSDRAADTVVFAEVEPLHKERIVRALRDHHQVVGFLGDGINDAAALHAADVGISVNMAVDVAKQSAAIILLDKSLAVVADGVRLGRQTFANTLKYIRVTTSANFGNMLSMAAAAAFLPFLPMLPRQILLLNFLSDIPGMAIAEDSVDSEQLERPRAWDLPSIRNFMIVFGLISSVLDVVTFLTLRLVLGANQALFRSGWFIESTITELAVMLVLRTNRPFYRSRPGRALLLASIAIAAITIALPYTPLAEPLGLTGVPAGILAALIGLTAVYVVTNELAK